MAPLQVKRTPSGPAFHGVQNTDGRLGRHRGMAGETRVTQVRLAWSTYEDVLPKLHLAESSQPKVAAE